MYTRRGAGRGGALGLAPVSLFSPPSPRFAASAASPWAFSCGRGSNGNKGRPSPASSREKRATREHPYQYRRWKCHRPRRLRARARPLAATFGLVTVVPVRAWAISFAARSGRTAHFPFTQTKVHTKAHAQTHAQSCIHTEIHGAFRTARKERTCACVKLTLLTSASRERQVL